MITKDSTLREVLAHPVGHDMLTRLLLQMGRSPALLGNALVGNMRLRLLERLLGRQMPGVVDVLVDLLNQQPDTAPPRGDTRPAWWKEAVIYQIYPRSFQDSNGDGIGDLAGIRSRVPYLKELGVDAVWLSPIYDSPGDDNGYDVRDYRKIAKEYGNLRDFSALVSELHKNGIKLIMDLVVNHTSDEHAWFKKALADPDAPEKDYYLWAKGKNGLEPNNWTSWFSGPAWNYYPGHDEWALHLFSKKQMDLNWDNPALRAEVYDMVNWWLDKGVDGFRLDVISLISKNSYADGNEALGRAFGFVGVEHYIYGPHLHEYLREFREKTVGPRGAFTVGETPGTGVEMSRQLTAESRGELDMVFNFDILDNAGRSRYDGYEYDLRQLKPYFLQWQRDYTGDCWQALFFDNHDNPRMVSKVNADPAWRLVVAKLLAMLQCTLRGTPFLYQGQELGMTNTSFRGPEDLRDVEALNLYRELAGSNPAAEREAFKRVATGTRDHARTPMQWSGEDNAGFTSGTPWLDVNPNFPVINAENEMANPDSVFRFTQKLIALRRENSTLVYGEFHPVFVRDANVLCYFRVEGHEKFYVEVNLTRADQKRPGPLTAGHHLLAGNYGGVAARLRPYEANLYRVGG